MFKVLMSVFFIFGVVSASAEDNKDMSVVSRSTIDTSKIDGDMIFVAEDLQNNAQAEEVQTFQKEISELNDDQALVVKASFFGGHHHSHHRGHGGYNGGYHGGYNPGGGYYPQPRPYYQPSYPQHYPNQYNNGGYYGGYSGGCVQGSYYVPNFGCYRPGY